MKKIFVALCLLTAPCLTNAFTECSVNLTKVLTDNGGNFFIGTGGYLNGYIPPGAPGFASSVAAAIAARVSDRPAIVRYQRDGVVCANADWTEVISGIGF